MKNRLFRRIGVSAILAATFVTDLVASSLHVARIVLSRKDLARPAIVPVPVTAQTDWGVALLAYFTSLTPGSTCLHVADDRRHIYVHMLDAPDDAAAASRFKRLYEKWILELEK